LRSYIGYNNDNLKDLIRTEKDSNGNDSIVLFADRNWKTYDMIIRSANQAMRLCGYFPSLSHDITDEDESVTAIQYDAKYEDKKIDIRKYGFIFHTTPNKNIPKIMSIGLCPYHKNGLFDYPPRIYFFKGDTSISTIKKMVRSMEKENGFTNKNYSLLTIDTSKIGDEVEFYPDPNYQFGLFTYGNIGKEAIVKCENLIDFNF
jgi:hypothetical protein